MLQINNLISKTTEIHMDVSTKMLITNMVNIIFLTVLSAGVSWLYKKRTGISQKQMNLLSLLLIIFYLLGIITMYVIGLIIPK